MTRDDIIRMGSEADLFIYNSDDPTLIVWLIPTEEKFLKFATLVAAAEREACAELCEKRGAVFATDGSSMSSIIHENEARQCADMIRAWGKI